MKLPTELLLILSSPPPVPTEAPAGDSIATTVSVVAAVVSAIAALLAITYRPRPLWVLSPIWFSNHTPPGPSPTKFFISNHGDGPALDVVEFSRGDRSTKWVATRSTRRWARIEPGGAIPFQRSFMPTEYDRAKAANWRGGDDIAGDFAGEQIKITWRATPLLFIRRSKVFTLDNASYTVGVEPNEPWPSHKMPLSGLPRQP